MTEKEAIDFFQWCTRFTGKADFPGNEPEHIKALLVIYAACKEETLFLIENKIEASFVGWLLDENLEKKIPPKVIWEDEDTPQPDDDEQARFILDCIDRYQYEYTQNKSLIFKAKSAEDAIEELLNDEMMKPFIERIERK